MRMLILDEADRERAGVDNINRGRHGENGRADAMPIERLYLFAGWTLEETARNLVSPAGRRVDLTSSEFNLLLAFVRQPGQALSRDALSARSEAGNGRISIVRSTPSLRDCARSWPSAPTGPRSFARCAASVIFSAPRSPGFTEEDNPPPHEPD